MTSWNEEEKRRAGALIPRLLAERDRLTLLEKEQIIDAVLKRVSEEKAAARRSWLYALATASAVAIVLLVALPTLDRDEFARRGPLPLGPAFETYCVASDGKTPCKRGVKLVFELHPSPERPFFSAFSRASDGTVIWYFPAGETQESFDATKQHDGVATTGFVLGAEHTPGTYRVFGLFSGQALSREEVRRRVEGSTAALIEKSLVVVE